MCVCVCGGFDLLVCFLLVVVGNLKKKNSLGARDVRHQLVQLISQPTDLIIPQNIVYQHPSISKLSDWLLSILSDSVDQTFLNHDQALERLRQMILKYSPQQASKTFTVL